MIFRKLLKKTKFTKTGLTIICGSLFLVAVFLPNTKVQATTFTVTQSCDLGLSRTFWSRSCDFDKFDSSLGSLLSVDINLATEVETDARFENVDAITRNLDATFGASIEVEDPLGGVLVATLPTTTVIENFTAWDGTTDYSGTSGVTYPTFTQLGQDSITVTTGDTFFTDFVATIPGEQITLPVGADSYLTYNNGLAANFASVVETFASAEINIVYSYLAYDGMIEKTADQNPFLADGQGTFTFDISNNDPDIIPGPITLTDNLPSGLSFVSDNSVEWDCSASSGQNIVCQNPNDLAVGSTSSFQITVNISEDASYSLSNTATIDIGGVDFNLANNTDTVGITVNHRPRPVANEITIDECVMNMITKLESNLLEGLDDDPGSSITSYRVSALPNSAVGLIYLGHPDSGGINLNLNQSLSNSELDNLYLQILDCQEGPIALDYYVTDNFGSESLSEAPATINLVPIVIENGTETEEENNDQENEENESNLTNPQPEILVTLVRTGGAF